MEKLVNFLLHLLFKFPMQLKQLGKITLTISLYAFGLYQTTYDNIVLAAEEYQLKAVFVYNFTKGFITWPKTVFSNEHSPLRICVLGEDPFGPTIDEVVKGQTTRENRTLIVERLENTSHLGGCQIVFVSRSEQSQVKEMLTEIKHSPILTISDIEGFAQQGGMIEFFMLQDKVKLAINSCILENSGLKANANLLNLSKLIRTCQE